MMSGEGRGFVSGEKVDGLISFILMVILFFTPLAGGTEKGVSVWGVHILVLVLLSLWIFDTIRGKRLRLVRTPLDYPLLCFAVLSIISAIFSVSPRESFLTLLNFFDYIVLYYLVVNKVRMRDRKQVSFIMYTIIAAGSVAALFGILKYLGSSSNILGFTYYNPNPFGAYLATVIPVTLAMMMLTPDLGKKILIGYGICMMMIAFALTLSRGGWGSLLCAFFLMACLYYKKFGSFSGMAFISASFITGVALVFIMVLGYVNVKREIAAINKGRIESVSGRMPIWKGTLDMIRTYPLLGAGPGTFPLLCEDYIGKYVSNLRDKYAHSEYLQTGAEWGGFSLLIIFWIQILFFLAAFRAYAQAHTRFSQYLRLGILGSITAISIHSLAEFALHPMANAILCVVLGALAINSHNR